MKLSKAEVSLMLRKWDILIKETKSQLKKANKDKGEEIWEKEFHATRLKRFVERHAKGNEILEKNLQYLIVYTRLKKPNIRDVSLDLLSLDKDGNAKCLFCENEPIVGYVYEPHPSNTIGRDIAFLLWVDDNCELKLNDYNLLIGQKVDELYAKKSY